LRRQEVIAPRLPAQIDCRFQVSAVTDPALRSHRAGVRAITLPARNIEKREMLQRL